MVKKKTNKFISKYCLASSLHFYVQVTDVRGENVNVI